jgi:hypothetical protein
MSTEPAEDDTGGDDVIARGIEALQAATAEAIAAARAVLDVAEELATDPRTATAVSNLLSSVGRGKPRGRHDDDGGEGGGVQRIPVS